MISKTHCQVKKKKKKGVEPSLEVENSVARDEDKKTYFLCISFCIFCILHHEEMVEN